MARVLLALCGGLLLGPAAATTYRDVCIDTHFAPSFDSLSDPALVAPRDSLRDGDAVFAAVAGKRGLEIGGPTPLAAHIYAALASCDNLAQFADATHARPELVDGAPFAPLDDRPPTGRHIVGDAARLTSVVRPGSYEVLFASHILEHMKDPLGALREWDAALSPGGVLFLVLPWRDPTFDRFRAPNTLDQLAQKYVRARAGESGALGADLEQVVRTIDLARDWGFPPGATADDLRARTLASPEGAEMLHWHVFDFHLLKELYACLNYDVVAMDLVAPFHQIVVGVKRGA